MLRRGTQNCAYPMEHDAPLIAYARERCDVLGTQELRHRDGRPIDIRPLLGAGWASNQDARNGERSAAAVAWRIIVAIHYVWSLRAAIGERALRRARHLQRRYYSEVVTIDPHSGGRCHEIAIHIALKSTRAQAAMVAVMAARTRWLRIRRPQHAWCLYVDANMPVARFARLVGGVAHGPNVHHRIVGHVCSRNLRVASTRVDHHVDQVEHWTDHPLVITTSEAPPLR